MSGVRRYTYDADTVVLGGQDPVNLYHLQLPFQASIHVDLVSGTINYGVEFTTDDLTGDPSTFRWRSDPVSLPDGQTESGVFKIESAVTGVRLNIQSLTGEVRFAVIQGMDK